MAMMLGRACVMVRLVARLRELRASTDCEDYHRHASGLLPEPAALQFGSIVARFVSSAQKSSVRPTRA
jgi:hypothetical protein